MYDRRKCVGASDAVHIQAGQWADLYDRKQATTPPEYVLAAEIGHELESLNLRWFQRETGIRVQTSAEWEEYPLCLLDEQWYTYLPDGLIKDTKVNKLSTIPFEAKAINMMWKSHNLIAKYQPQLQHAMRVMKAPYCYFSVIYLNIKFEYYKIPYDPPYADALFEKEKLFYWFLDNEVRPPEKKGRNWI